MYRFVLYNIFPSKRPLSLMAGILPLHGEMQYYNYLTCDVKCMFYRILLTSFRLLGNAPNH